MEPYDDGEMSSCAGSITACINIGAGFIEEQEEQEEERNEEKIINEGPFSFSFHQKMVSD